MLTYRFLAAAVVPAFLVGLADAGGRKNLGQIVEDATRVPERFIGRVVCEKWNGTRYEYLTYGSGVMIGPKHVLTAAHNAFDAAITTKSKEYGAAGYHDRLIRVPGARLDARPLGSAVVAIPHMHRAYTEYSHTSDSETDWTNRNLFIANLDITILELEREVPGIGTGFFRYQALTDAEIRRKGNGFRLNGYDHEISHDAAAFRRHFRLSQPTNALYYSGQNTRQLSLEPHRFRYRPSLLRESSVSAWTSNDTVATFGCSGGPVWTMIGGRPTVVGVLTNRTRGSRIPGGPLLDEFYVKWIDSVVSGK